MLAKIWVHLINGSSSMLAEALHSLADVLNQLVSAGLRKLIARCARLKRG